MDAASSDLTHYDLFGLRVASEIALPEALQIEMVEQPDLIVRYAPIEIPDQLPGFNVVEKGLLLNAPDTARYLISGGREILIDRSSGTPEKNVRLYLLGSAMGAALHQRGLLPLHANAVVIEGRAIVFTGESGAGKSTLAAWFDDHGYPVLSDDVSVVNGIGKGRPFVHPSVRRLRLCHDALIASGRSANDFEPSYWGDPEFTKYDVPLAQADSAARPLSDIVALEFGERSRLEPLEGIAAAEMLFAHTYRGVVIEQLGSARLHWQAVTRLLPAVRVWRWTRRRRLDLIGSEIERLLAALNA